MQTKFEKLERNGKEESTKSDIIDLMVAFEEEEISFQTEKSKILSLEKIKA